MPTFQYEAMDKRTGLEVKEAMTRSGRDVVTVFITGNDDVATGVQAMKAGAEDFLLKPFEEETLFKTAYVIEQAAGKFQPAKWW